MHTTADKPMFSILMPLYNHEAYLREAIESVLRQEFSDWQLVICNDGSTDRSAEIASEYARRDERIELVHQANAGAGPARNTARRSARGQWLTFFDSDDLYYPNALQLFAEYIDAHPASRFIYGYRHRLNQGGTVEELAGEFQEGVTTAVELFQRMYISSLCVTFRADLYDKVGGFDERLRSCEDYDFYLRLSQHTDFHPLQKPTGLRRRHDTNVSIQTGFSRLQEAMVLERYLAEFGGRAIVPQAIVDKRLGKLYYAAGRQYFKQGFFRQSRRALRTALGHCATFKARLLRATATLLSISPRIDERPLPKL
jgi:glycosyltransferase involved in cell wall biosynthesis